MGDLMQLLVSKETIIDKLFQFILLTAGQEDYYQDRELGPIHLIKYLYLADLSFSEENNGITFTNLPWKFHHFGPWSSEAFLRINPALAAIGATKKEIPSAYEGDFIRWSLHNDKLLSALSIQIPLIIASKVRYFVHKFTSCTEDLLHYVYITKPMLISAPGELLDFAPESNSIKAPVESEDVSGQNTSCVLSVREKKSRKQAIQEIRNNLGKILSNRKDKKRIIPKAPRYDDIFYNAIDILDSIAGETMPIVEGVAEFSDEIWKSKSRFDPDVF